MARPYTSKRPIEYPAKPKPIRSKKGLANLPKGPNALGGLLTIKFLSDTPKFLTDLQNKYGDTASFFL